MSHAPITARRRPDLLATETRHKHNASVVVKDPVGLKYVQLRPDEFFVLSLLDGNVSLELIRDAYEKRFAPSKVTLAELNQLLFRFHRNGLTIADQALQGDQLNQRRQEEIRQRRLQHFSSILFIRFPGVDPEPLLRRLYPLVRPLLGTVGIILSVLLLSFAAVLLTSRWDVFQSEFPRMSQWMRFDSIMILAAVIGITKIFHELGHAIICKHYGGECHCIGPMLLVFTPALYCDTSDSWMLPNRFHRAAVGLAGIGVELQLAAMATILWSLTSSGTTHYVAMNVMVVCSISTLLFNANPLLRYDGYYVLSDLCNVPNLGQRSRELLAWYAKRWFLGIDEPLAHPISGIGRFWMLLYALTSALYRWGLTLLILWFVSQMLRPQRLESVGLVICTVAAAGMIGFALRAPWSLVNNPARRRNIRMKRLVASAVIAAALIAASCWPIPDRVSAEGRIVPETETPIVIKTPGRLDHLARELGEVVAKGEVIAELSNAEIELQFVQAKGRYETQALLVEAIKRTRLNQPDAGNELPAAESLLEEFRQQLEKRQTQKESLVLRAPTSGRLVVGPRRSEPRIKEGDHSHRLIQWTGFPTDERNEGCFMDVGTELMSIASDGLWDAELILTQTEVQEIEVGATVTLSLDTLPSAPISGVVKSIDTDRWTTERNASRHDDPSSAMRDEPRLTSYTVRVMIDKTELPLTTGAAVNALVDSAPKSIATRLSRSLNSLFRFR